VSEAPRLGAARAFAIFALVFGAQIIYGFVVVILGVILLMAQGANPGDSAAVARMMGQLNAPLLLVSVAAGAIVLFGIMEIWAHNWLRDRGATGFGELKKPRQQFAIATASGFALAAAYFALVRLFPPSKEMAGPLAQMAASSAAARAAWAVIAVAIAPPTEEVLFRGLLLKGFTESWGAIPASIAVTLLFTVSHLFEVARYWPAALTIFTLAIATLVIRVRTGSVASAIVLHMAYNTVLVAIMYAGKWLV